MPLRSHSADRPARPRPVRRAWRVAAAAPLLAAAACSGAGPLAERLAPATAHERYERSLRDAGLATTALGAAWLAAADSAVARASPVSLPFRESGYFGADEARAVAYRFTLRAGQRLVAEVAREGDGSALLFADLFELPEDSLAAAERIASADSTLAPLEVTARRETAYVLRVQPELLRSVRWTLTLQVGPSLAVFPVAGRSTAAVRSAFGVARDGGQREHHGIDIFAPRGTPVVAATDGRVRSTTPSRRGGKLVWLRDARVGQSLYYAHLDTVFVLPGQQVRAGDTLGLVGNTGNAITTPPHLHFGIYARGPVDPYYFVHRPKAELPALGATVAALGAERRTSARTTLRTRPDAASGTSLAAGTPLRVVGVAGGAFRVLLADGRGGWVGARSVEALDAPLRRTRLAGAAALRDRPAPDGVTIDSLARGRSLPVLGSLGAYVLVRDGARRGWVSTLTD